MSTNQENIEKAFYSDGYQLGMKAVETGLSEPHLYAAIKEMYSNIDNLINTLFEFAEQQGQAIACKKGCEWCCHQPIFAMDYELGLLADFVSKNISEDEQLQLKTRAKEKKVRLSSLNDEEQLNAKDSCPLLKKGACIAYEARPMACRIYLSSSVESCLKFFEEPDDKTNFPALLEMPIRIGRMMNEGFKAALKINGLDPREFRIEDKFCNKSTFL